MPHSDPSDIYTVAIRQVADVKPGDVIWVDDDGDWFEVKRIGGKFSPELYRADGSCASFEYDESRVLVRL